jgi:hypothetical protein
VCPLLALLTSVAEHSPTARQTLKQAIFPNLPLPSTPPPNMKDLTLTHAQGYANSPHTSHVIIHAGVAPLLSPTDLCLCLYGCVTVRVCMTVSDSLCFVCLCVCLVVVCVVCRRLVLAWSQPTPPSTAYDTNSSNSCRYTHTTLSHLATKQGV